jgi:hypothetical protein
MANRTLICTVAALSSGIFGFWAGGQMNLAIEQQNCEGRSWGLGAACKTLVAPGALWKGSTAGLWVGAILGAFLAGSLTRTTQDNPEPPTQTLGANNSTIDLTTLTADEIAITPPQDESMRCLLVLMAIQNGTTETAQMLQPQSLTDARQLLSPLGFSDLAIDQAWQFFQTIRQNQK